MRLHPSSVLPLLVVPAFAAAFAWRWSVRPVAPGTPWIYLALSALAVIVYAVDKRSARRGEWRVSERNLLLVGLLGGWPGAIIAQQGLHHKTRKRTFQWAFWVTVVVNAVVVLAFF